VDYFEAHPDIDLLFGDCVFIREDGQTVKTVRGREFCLTDGLSSKSSLLQPGAFWRRHVSERIGGFDESLHYTMDLDYWLRAALAGCQLDYVPGIRAAFRLHGQSKTVSQSAAFWHDWRLMIDKIYATPNLAPEIVECMPDSYAYLDWHDAKMAWVENDYATARPLLRRFLRGKKWVRRGLAAPMLVDSYLGTPFTRLLTVSYKRLRGVDLLAP
jgi:GT2 family glycosyltransferase